MAENNFAGVIESLMNGMNSVLSTKTVVGEATQVGDTITDNKNPCTQALPGFKPSIPVVLCYNFPVYNIVKGVFKDANANLKRNHTNID